MRRLIAPFIWSLTAVAGCGVLSQPPAAKSYFAIDPGQPPQAHLAAASTRSPDKATVLLVRALHVRPPYDGLPFVYRIGPSQFDTDYYNNFIAAPASLLTGATVRWIAESTPLTVCEASTDLPHELVLEGNVTDLYIDSTDHTSSKAVIAGRFFLTREHEGDVSLVWQKRYEAVAPVPSRTAAGFAHAWGEASGKLLGELTRDLNAVASRPPKGSAGGQ